MPKRPMGFPTPNFVQGQVSASTTGGPGGGPIQQLQSNQAMVHAGNVFITAIVTFAHYEIPDISFVCCLVVTVASMMQNEL